MHACYYGDKLIYTKMATLGGLDPTMIPQFAERKGSLTLRSEYMRYGRGVLNNSWHADRESEPKDYDICDLSKKQNLQLATYNKIGEDGVPVDLQQTTSNAATREATELKDDYRIRDVHKTPVSMENFTSTVARVGHNDEPQNDVLPKHKPEHNARFLHTTYGLDYQYPFPWVPSPEQTDSTPEKRYSRKLSSFADTTTHKLKGINTWHDSSGALRNYD